METDFLLYLTFLHSAGVENDVKVEKHTLEPVWPLARELYLADIKEPHHD